MKTFKTKTLFSALLVFGLCLCCLPARAQDGGGEPQSDAEKRVTDPNDIITLHTSQDIDARRKELVRFLWGADFLPSRVAVPVRCTLDKAKFPDYTSLRKIELLKVDMDFGLDSGITCFFPIKSNNRVVLYHHGHGEASISHKQTTKLMLDEGFTVIHFNMPLIGGNSIPAVDIPHLGLIRMESHDQMKFLRPEKGHALRYFVEPVVAVLNYLERNYRFDDVTMIGISGGAWTTTVAAAVDARIKSSFAVAGSYPIYLRQAHDWGDWEQTVPEFYRIANYLELYIMGAAGQGRRRVQVINRYDNNCFRGTVARSYEMQVKRAVMAQGAGDYDLWIDESHDRHIISEPVLGRIRDMLLSGDEN